MNRARIRGIDHFGLTIRSLRQATHDLENALGLRSATSKARSLIGNPDGWRRNWGPGEAAH